MKVRQFSNIECVKLQINGAGSYYFPKVAFANKKIDSMLFFAIGENQWNNQFNRGFAENLNDFYISIFSIDKKPLFVNTSCLSFRIDNFNNRIEEVIDYELSCVNYTGNGILTLYCYFSLDEKIIELEKFANEKLKCKNLTINFIERLNNNIQYIFDENDIEYFRNRICRSLYIVPVISREDFYPFYFFINITTKSGKSFNKIPIQFFTQDYMRSTSLTPFIIDDALDLGRSNVDFSEPMEFYGTAIGVIDFNSFDLSVFYK